MGPCPVCEADLVISDQVEWVTCPGCGTKLHVRAQQAFARAHAAYLEAEVLADEGHVVEPRRAGYRAKARTNAAPLDEDLVRAYQQAYSGLHVALQHTLVASQQLSGVTMMAEITRRLAPRGMASSLEAEYWTALAIELTVRDELATLEKTLAAGSKRTWLVRAVQAFPQRLRRRQLLSALRRLRGQVNELEKAIGFLEPPQIERRGEEA